MMFMKRLRAVEIKQSLMAEKSLSENESIAESKLLYALKSPLFADKPVGLGIVDALTADKTVEKSPKGDITGVNVFFGSKLKIQIPPINTADQSPLSPLEFGIKTKNSKLALFSPSGRSPDVLFVRSLSAKDIELSEDYTCVISHGPNPKTTHIFDNCILESFDDQGFISCYACDKGLVGQEKEDTLIYRGEKAFCSHECCNQEMMLDQGLEKCSPDSSVNL
ncbi:hypothetical protein J5N97_010767 [Dioscorea zingiberensis]|uniref:FLZ-type domain-containing protein n=1 Tax=Dioscorea zingiberensis TaxID=325984 RepID=A0A9D5D1B0_9LILI|nr:hypothetical protein J5N97_010767 [Dioscorea zingiberensis]